MSQPSLTELSLFSGAGGGLLGTKLLDWRCLGYVENNDYCQRVLKARIEDGLLDRAPIFGDIKAFISQGYASSYTGMVDVVTAGFPCQPFSVAGKKAGEQDSRNLWPETIECIRVVRPRFVVCENVPGLLADRYFGRILADLSSCGYSVRWDCVSASAVGANHQRDRLWIVGVTNSQCHQLWNQPGRGSRESWASQAQPPNNGEEVDVADTACSRQRSRIQRSGVKLVRTEKRRDFTQRREEVADTQQHRCEQMEQSEPPRTQGKRSICTPSNSRKSTGRRWWETEPNVGRVANGVANRVDRLKALGNGQVPAVVQAVWKFSNITEEFL